MHTISGQLPQSTTTVHAPASQPDTPDGRRFLGADADSAAQSARTAPHTHFLEVPSAGSHRSAGGPATTTSSYTCAVQSYEATRIENRELTHTHTLAGVIIVSE